ncbi:helix-turn-helix domain-containing protein, partial [bacterium]|nr:helix-turn-helix domain-containing protein [bacterium]
ELEAAASLMNPMRLEILEALKVEEGSSTTLGERLGRNRQKLNYHLRELEKQGFLEIAEERRRRNFIEVVYRSKAESWLISPDLLGKLTPLVEEKTDQLTASYLIASATKIIRDISLLMKGATKAKKRLSTLTINTEVRFKDASARRQFAEELTSQIAGLVVKYNNDKEPGGREYSLTLGFYPKVKEEN